MCHRLRIVALVLAMAAASPGHAQDVRFTRLDPNSFQSFVANWSPDGEPTCALMRSQADWDKVMRPAAVMGGTKPFAPPPAVWAHSAVLLLARVVDAGRMDDVFKVRAVRAAAGGLAVDYAFTPPPPASPQVKWWLGVEVAKPVPVPVRFIENGRVVCSAGGR